MNAIAQPLRHLLNEGEKSGRIAPVTATVLSTGLVALIGWLDYITGDFSLAVFYLVPIGFSTWFAGRKCGWFTVMVGSAVWLGVDLALRHAYRHALMPYWNALTAAMTFGIFVQILSALHRVQTELEARLERRTVSLAEVHHRVKNNLQVISSLLMLRSEMLTDPADRAVFEECRERIHFMARLHEQLYSKGEFAQLDFAAHLKEMAEMLVRAHTPPGCALALEFHIDPIAVDLDTAVTLGLIANELLLNSLKHGFAGREMGRLSLELHEDDQIQMSVRDDGCGLPPGFDGGKNAGLGTELIHGMTRQLGGRAEIVREPAGGTRATIRFRSTANSKQRLT